jgi:replicative DNA helicase
MSIYEDQSATIMAEQRLLNSVYHKPELLDRDDISENILIHDLSKNIFNSIKKVKDSGVPISIEEVLMQVVAIDPDIDRSILEVTFNKEHTETLDNILVRLKSAKKVSSLREKFNESLDLIDNNGLADEEKRKTIMSGLGELQNIISTSDDINKVYDFPEWFDIYEPELALRASGKRYKFNNQVLDKLVPTGPLPGNGGLVVASSGMGKSAMVLNLVNNLIDVEIPTFYFSLEMSKIDTMDRLLSIRSGIPFKNLINPDIETWLGIQAMVKKQKEELVKKNLFRFCEDASLSIEDCKKQIKDFQAETGSKYMVVIFDLLSMLTDFNQSKNGANFAQIAEVGINKLNAIAKELEVHWIGVLQIGRGAEDSRIKNVDDIENTKPKRQDIKNSNSYLERSRYVISLWRPLYYAQMYLENKEEYEATYPEDIIHLKLLKASNTEIIGGKMLFDGSTFTCSILEEADD